MSDKELRDWIEGELAVLMIAGRKGVAKVFINGPVDRARAEAAMAQAVQLYEQLPKPTK